MKTPPRRFERVKVKLRSATAANKILAFLRGTDYSIHRRKDEPRMAYALVINMTSKRVLRLENERSYERCTATLAPNTSTAMQLIESFHRKERITYRQKNARDELISEGKLKKFKEDKGFGVGPEYLSNAEDMSRLEARQMVFAQGYGAGAKARSEEVAQENEPWKFKAAYSIDAIDFYEIAETLSRQQPMAYVHADNNGAYVVVHKQLVRQACGKYGSSNTKMPGAVRHTLPHKHYPLSFGDAFVFILAHPREFNEWSNWAKAVKQAPWPEMKTTFSVNYPKV